MSTLRDLRTVLVERADALDDPDRYIRPVAVRARIRTARRRRTGVVAVAVAATVVLAAVVVGAVRAPAGIQPADVAGVEVPGSIQVLGFPYDRDHTATLGSDDQDRLGETDRERAVVLVGSGLGDGSATLFADSEAVARVRSGSQTSVPVSVNAPDAVLRIRYDGTPVGARAGVAVYESTGELAAGVSDGESVFRESYAGQPLLGAAFADEGAPSVDFQADGAGSMRFVTSCDSEGHYYVNVDVDGKPALAIGCSGTWADAASGSAGTLDHLDPGTHDVHVYLSDDGKDGTPIAVDGVRFGAAVYAEDDTVEYAGRAWRLVATRHPEDGRTTVDTTDGDVLLGVAGRGNHTLFWTGQLSKGRSLSQMRGYGSTLAGVLVAGDVYQVRAARPDVAIRVYRPE
ncbi:hypothetical protein [Nocardioides mangrovi]|uniref:Uncharacterized protein n=1 Tax=Nocardioides mangrovi TaxID=2874580 RepID=A0ABS7U9K2_9ACTN|nr:hypothetical protein [Nocardioides mangrovi]MBZ5737550.1 hypothetical protein [Nocardioides mangrovi]